MALGFCVERVAMSGLCDVPCQPIERLGRCVEYVGGVGSVGAADKLGDRHQKDVEGLPYRQPLAAIRSQKPNRDVEAVADDTAMGQAQEVVRVTPERRRWLRVHIDITPLVSFVTTGKLRLSIPCIAPLQKDPHFVCADCGEEVVKAICSGGDVDGG